ncbi:hypothetical protein A2W14_05610 [Candidatus Gottesmanbacteria bacterium RBG_16_37_8]|uniref:SCP domain-containing protein n=1 Tax=Candidatus Gottesmanbacteria bacterium RBG_16_37_8 TaxID=1798371 RepID=A0A1F5YVC2_9BACT|nr:MAG: hypothetical protein A2W14_05610 [Candidatus Gottesmanbacteria bacterium RBG_16_37_8]
MNAEFFQGNWLDLIILITFAIYLLSGWGRGFFLGTLDLLGFLFSFVFALKLYAQAGLLLRNNFGLTRGIANALGFFIAGILSEFIYSFAVNFSVNKFYSKVSVLLNNKKRLNLLKTVDSWLGFIPAIGEAVIFTAFILTLLVTLPIQGRIKKDIVSSRIGGLLVKSTQGIENQLNTVFGEAVNETLTFLTINSSPTSAESIDLGFIYKEGKVDTAAENSMLTLVNIERQKNNLSLLQSSAELQELARNYARDLFGGGYFSHYNPEGESPFDRMKINNISFLAAGENLALAPNVVLAHQGLMNSSGHRANILSADFNKVGIGVIDGGIYGLLFVQEFTN